jgi:hypothetical protein
MTKQALNSMFSEKPLSDGPQGPLGEAHHLDGRAASCTIQRLESNVS